LKAEDAGGWGVPLWEGAGDVKEANWEKGGGLERLPLAELPSVMVDRSAGPGISVSKVSRCVSQEVGRIKNSLVLVPKPSERAPPWP
jgi:hypothetical protein